MTKSWHNAINLDTWMCLHDESWDIKTAFRLRGYSINDGVPKFSVQIADQTELEGGMAELRIGRDLFMRFYLPIELVKPDGFRGWVPKFVFTMPKELKISPLASVQRHKSTFQDKARTHKLQKITLR